MVSARDFLHRNLLVVIAGLSSLVMGSYLLTYAWPQRIYKPNQPIWDAIWLDGWGLLFLASLIAVIIWQQAERTRARFLLTLFCWYGLVTMTVVFAGTDFGMNGIWGDQKFRVAMILKMSTWLWPTDYYYSDLPTHYPPLLYWLKGIIARLFSIEAYRMLKLGSLGIYALGPILSYLLWRRLVSPLRAIFITIATFLLASTGKPIPLLAPHAFLSNMLFIPWWLYYVEEATARERTWQHRLIGSLIGGGLFMTYYFPFFIGGFVLVARLVWKLARGKTGLWPMRYWLSVAAILGGSAIVSSLYWLPLLLAFLEHGLSSAQQRWHHADSTGILFAFQSFSTTGVVFLAALYYGLRRHWSPISRALLWLLGGAIGFYLVGAILGALDRPVNLVKTDDIISMLAGPFVGLTASALLRWSKKGHRRKVSMAILLLIVTGIYVDRFNSRVQDNMVKTARTASLPEYEMSPEAAEAIKGKVVLTRYEELFCFYPAYSYIALNEHYSNPASRFPERYEMLHLLEILNDPYLLNLALRTNKYDRVDYFMPRLVDSSYELVVALSNYPDKHRHQWLHFPLWTTTNPDLFEPLEGRNLFLVRVPVTGQTKLDMTFDNLRLRLAYEYPRRVLANYLSPQGRGELDQYLRNDSADESIILEGNRQLMGGIARLLDARLVRTEKTSTLLFALKVEKETPQDYRIFAHLIDDSGMTNLDFDPPTPTRSWFKGDIMFLQRELTDREASGSLILGFFNENGSLGDVVKLEL